MSSPPSPAAKPGRCRDTNEPSPAVFHVRPIEGRPSTRTGELATTSSTSRWPERRNVVVRPRPVASSTPAAIPTSLGCCDPGSSQSSLALRPDRETPDDAVEVRQSAPVDVHRRAAVAVLAAEPHRSVVDESAAIVEQEPGRSSVTADVEVRVAITVEVRIDRARRGRLGDAGLDRDIPRDDPIRRPSDRERRDAWSTMVTGLALAGEEHARAVGIAVRTLLDRLLVADRVQVDVGDGPDDA